MKSPSTVLLLLLCFFQWKSSMSFQPASVSVSRGLTKATNHRDQRACPLYMKNNEKPEYSRELMLREEAESPFRKVRFALYILLGGGAATSLAVSAARIAAASAGINADLMQESVTNAAVDLVGMIVLFILYQRDLKAQESRLKRASKGAELAKLKVRASKGMIQGIEADELEGTDDDSASSFTTSLASLRRGRGIEKRVVIAVGGKSKMEQVIQEATKFEDALEFNDLLIVPVVLPQGVAPDMTGSSIPKSVALPVSGGESNWNFVITDEAEEAKRQGIDVQTEGFCVILKKNGRVGQRTRGVNLLNMVGEVMARRDAGMDVSNI